MKKLDIPVLEDIHYASPIDQQLAALESLPAHPVDEVPWTAFPYKPDVRFRIAHTADSIMLMYDVNEHHVKAVHRNSNDPVHKDSCVEFFVSFDNKYYYNLEFNCLGVGYIAYGNADRSRRRQLPKSTVEKVKTYSVMGEGDQPVNSWRLLLVIPFLIFEEHQIDSLSGVQCTGNFYKCGDDLPVPHFLSWNRIDFPNPNFHLPEYFGELVFE